MAKGGGTSPAHGGAQTIQQMNGVWTFSLEKKEGLYIHSNRHEYILM